MTKPPGSKFTSKYINWQIKQLCIYWGMKSINPIWLQRQMETKEKKKERNIQLKLNGTKDIKDTNIWT